MRDHVDVAVAAPSEMPEEPSTRRSSCGSRCGHSPGCASPFVLVIAQMVSDLALQSGLDYQLGQLGQQAVLPIKGQTARAGLTHQLGNHTLVNNRRRKRCGHTAARSGLGCRGTGPAPSHRRS